MPSHASVYASLERFRREYRLTYVDVGARWGAKSALLALFPNSRWVGFEPDRDECATINAKRQRRQECLPYALSEVAGSRRLHITKSPDWSSLYEPDPEVFGQFNGLVDFYPVMRQVEVSTGSLDELVVDHWVARCWRCRGHRVPFKTPGHAARVCPTAGHQHFNCPRDPSE